MMATQLGQQIQKDIATSRGMIEVARQNDASGAAASFKGQDAVAMMQRVPILIDAMADAVYSIVTYPSMYKSLRELGLEEVNNIKWYDAGLKVRDIYNLVTGMH